LVSSPIWDFWPEIFFFLFFLSFFFFFFLKKSYCPVIWGRPLWREVGPVIYQSLSIQSRVVNQILHKLFTVSSVQWSFMSVSGYRCAIHPPPPPHSLYVTRVANNYILTGCINWWLWFADRCATHWLNVTCSLNISLIF
jgi:hypothetical protein